MIARARRPDGPRSNPRLSHLRDRQARVRNARRRFPVLRRIRPAQPARRACGRGRRARCRGDEYIDVRGLPPLRAALADYLTALHAKPVAESRGRSRLPGWPRYRSLWRRLCGPASACVHSPAWPNVGNAALLRQAKVVELSLNALPDGRFSMDFDRLDALLQGARALILNSPNNPTGWTATRAGAGNHPGAVPQAWRLADLGRGILAPGV